MSIEHVFPTPIYTSQVRDLEQIQGEILPQITQLPFYMIDKFGSTHWLSTQTFKEDIIGDLQLNSFIAELDYHINEYCRVLAVPVPNYTRTSWFSLFKQGNYGHIHTHGGSDISGVYYYETNESDGDLFFEDPRPSSCTSIATNNLANRIRYTPQVGKLVLFPGWLPHGIMTNTTDNKRVSLSFNISF
jgi:uncharacterized protein (TIGR02466 family)